MIYLASARNKKLKRHKKMPDKKEKSILEQTFEDVAVIKEALQNNASNLLNADLKSELQEVVAEAIKETKKETKNVVKEAIDDEFENPESDDENIEVPSDDTPVSDELPTNDVVDDVTPTDIPPSDTDELAPEELPEPEEDVVDLTGASDEEVLKVFKKMNDEDEIEVVQKPDGDIELKIDGEEYYITKGEETPEVEEPEVDIDIEPTEELVAEGNHKEELARVKAMGQDGGNVDNSRRNDVSKPKEIGVAETGEVSPIHNNEHENSDKRDDVSKPAEKGVAEQNKGGGDIDSNVKANYEHGKNDKRTDVPKPKEIGVAKVEAVQGNISTEPTEDAKPNYDRGTKTTPEEYVAKVTDKTTVGIAEEVEQLKAKLNENHNKLVYTRQKYAEVIAENAKLRDSIETLNESVETYKNDEKDYKDAIITLKEEFNNVALFTSNLTYAVKLMTEHATTKQEKNQILERFDSAKTLAESETIYKTLNESFKSEKPSKKTIEEQIDKSVSSGSSNEINESTAYRNPELDRMKDLIHKINKF